MYNFLARLRFFETHNISIRNEIINRILHIRLSFLRFLYFHTSKRKTRLEKSDLHE